MGFALKDILRILCSKEFDKIKALESHKNVLKKNLDQTTNLIKTIDRTIAHLRGEIEMTNEEFYYGFDSDKQKNLEKDLVKKGIITQEFANECKTITQQWSEDEKADFLREGEEINTAFVAAIQKKLDPESNEVQILVSRHYAWITRNWTPTKENYLGLGQLYQTPEFNKFYDHHHCHDFYILATY